MSMTYKEWPLACECGWHGTAWFWNYDQPPDCPDCQEETHVSYEKRNRAPGLICDDFPGGIEIRHGICNDDGSPKKYYSKTDIKRACNEKGLKWADDTPGKPYPVSWSGKVRDEKAS